MVGSIASAVVTYLQGTESGKALDGLAADGLNAIRERFASFAEKRAAQEQENVEECLTRAAQKIQAKGGPTAQPSEADVSKFLRAAATADDADIKVMFANLLAAGFDRDRKDHTHPNCATTLAQMSSLDAQVLAEVLAAFKRHSPDERNIVRVNFDAGAKAFGVSLSVFATSAENMIRLGVFDRGGIIPNANISPSVGFTPFGWAMAQVCTGVEAVEDYYYRTPTTK